MMSCLLHTFIACNYCIKLRQAIRRETGCAMHNDDERKTRPIDIWIHLMYKYITTAPILQVISLTLLVSVQKVIRKFASATDVKCENVFSDHESSAVFVCGDCNDVRRHISTVFWHLLLSTRS
jgi:hypothetical protein